MSSKPKTGGRHGGHNIKPLEVKRAEGNPGKRPLPEAPMPGEGLTAADGTPEPPHPLGPVALQWWHQMWQAGRQWLSPDVDLMLVYDVCRNRQESADLQAALDNGEVERFYISNNGSQVIHPYVTAIRNLEAQRTTWLAMLGFSPADRARLGLTEVRVSDELDELEKRRAARG